MRVTSGNWDRRPEAAASPCDTELTPETAPAPAWPRPSASPTTVQPDENLPMADGTDDFNLHVDTLPPGELQAPAFAPPPAAPVVYVPPQPEAAPQPAPAAPAYPAAPAPNYVVVAPAVSPPPAEPLKSKRGVLAAVIVLLVLAGGAFFAHRAGWLNVPDLTSGSGSGNAAASTPKDKPESKAAEAAKPRPFKTTRDVLAAIRDHLSKTAEEDRRFQRYFTLDNLHNDKALSDKQLDEYREALKALVRFLQPAKDAIALEPIDPAKVVLRLDVRTVGWQKPQTWREVLARYPYGLVYTEAEDADLKDLAQKIGELSGSASYGYDLPLVRADWFLAAAGQGELRAKLGPQAAGEPPAALGALVQRYNEPVSLERAARELGLADGQKLRDAVQGKDWLQTRGLRPFLEGGTVPRDRWASSAANGVNTLYQEAAVVLNLAPPYRVH